MSFIRSQIQERRQFIWDEMDVLDRQERSLDKESIRETLELIDHYVCGFGCCTDED